jgi:hypothetical protein
MLASSRLLPALALTALLPLAGCIFEEESRPIVNETIVYNSGIQSETFTFNAAGIEYLPDFPDERGYYRHDTDLLTADLADAGLVMVYVEPSVFDPDPENQTWAALPLATGSDVDFDGLVDVTTTLGFSFEPGFLYIDVLASSPLIDGFGYLGRLDMRLVTIPPGEFLRAKDQLDFTDYDAVQRFYGLSE